MWGDPENGQTNGNGQPMYLADAYFNATTNQWSVPTAWSVAAQFEHQFTSQFYVDLLGSVGQISWSNQNNYYWNGSQNVGTGEISPKATSWIIGADLGWVPVTNLNFDLELMYQSTTQTAPSGFLDRARATARSSRACGKVTRAASPAVCALPVTSDRSLID